MDSSTFASILTTLGLNGIIPTPASEADYWKTILQLLILFAIGAWLYYKILGTYASQLLKGLVILFVIYLLTRLLGLTLLSQLFGIFLQIIVIGLIIIFQPELRRLLEYLGQRDKLLRRIFAASPNSKNMEVINTLVTAGKTLSDTRTGALIVLETKNELDNLILKSGTPIYANISTELLLTIFFPKTALHDGAAIIDSAGKVAAAGVVLPLTDSKLAWEYGTRHRAALGINERTNNPCLIVSEETGKISIVQDGTINYMGNLTELRSALEIIYNISDQPVKKSRRKLSDLLTSDVSQIVKDLSLTKK